LLTRRHIVLLRLRDVFVMNQILGENLAQTLRWRAGGAN